MLSRLCDGYQTCLNGYKYSNFNNKYLSSYFTNPVQNGKALDIRYQFDNTTNGDISFEVFNMLGQKVLVSRSVGKNRQGGDKRLMLNLVPGIYLLKVGNGKEQQTARFIVNQ